MSNVVIYARYSSHKQREESIEGQIRLCNKYAEEHDMRVIKEYIDRAETARTFTDRAGAMQLIADAKSKRFTAVLVYKFDRFSRDPADFYYYKKELQKNGVRLISISEKSGDGAQETLITGIHTAVNAYYSVELSEKVSRGMTENILHGTTNGSYRTYGYDIKDKKLVVNETEASIVKKAFRLYAEGKTSKEILDYINQLGYKTPQNKEFSHDYLYRMLRNKKYIGILQWNGIQYEDGIEQIVGKNLFDRVQKRLDENSNTGARAKAEIPYALVGKVYCGKCGQPMVADSVKKKIKTKTQPQISQQFGVATLNAITNAINDSEYEEEHIEGYKYYRYYVCRGQKQIAHKNDCDKERVNKDELENAVIAYTTQQYLCDTNIKRLAKATYNLRQKSKDNRVQKQLENKIKEENTKVQNLLDAIEDGCGTPRTYERLNEAEVRLFDLEEELKRWKEDNKDLTQEQIVEKLKGMRHKMEKYIVAGKIPTAIKKEFCDMFISSVYVYDDDDDGGRRVKIIFDEFETDGLVGFNEADISLSSIINSVGSPKTTARQVRAVVFLMN